MSSQQPLISADSKVRRGANENFRKRVQTLSSCKEVGSYEELNVLIVCVCRCMSVCVEDMFDALI